MLGAIDHGVVMGCAARKSQKPALEIGGWAGGAQVPCFCLQVCADNGEVWGGYGGRVRSVALATTRGCSAFHPLVFAGLAGTQAAHAHLHEIECVERLGLNSLICARCWAKMC